MDEVEWNEFWKKLFSYAENKRVGLRLTPDGWQSKSYKGHHQRVPTDSDLDIDYAYLVRDSFVSIALRLHRDLDDVYSRLHERKEAIERSFGAALTWDPHKGYKNPAKGMIKIQYKIFLGGSKSPKRFWPCLHHEMVEVMIRMSRAIDPHIVNH